MLKEFPLEKVHQLIGEGPVLLVVTSDGRRDNIMTMAWHTMLEFKPPLIGCCIAPQNHSLQALKKTRECVLAIPGRDLLEKAAGIGNCSGTEVDKFAHFRLHRDAAGEVKVPLIRECLYNIECRLTDTTLEKKYDFLVLEAVKAWCNPDRRERRVFHCGADDTFVISGRRVKREQH